MAATAPDTTRPNVAVYTADEVATILRLARVTIYEIARERPNTIGAIKFGRSVRFRRNVIDRIANGDER